MIYRIFLVLSISLLTISIVAQVSQQGGFIEGWDNYDNSNETGLGTRVVNFDFTGMRSIDSIPAVGVHPRVYFGPSEIPDIQNRLANTTSGQLVARQIHAYTTLLHKGYVAGGYNHNDSYAKDDFNNRWISNAGKWDSSSYYAKLIAEDPNAWDGADTKRKHITASIMALEAFECLIYAGTTDPDTGLDYDDRAMDLATAMAFWASQIIADPSLNYTDFREFGTSHMALAYDMNYNSMTTAQQDLVRQALAQITPTGPRHGAWIEAYAAASNWAGLNSFEIIINLAIEGEPGYSAALTERWVRAYHNFINYGWYPSGAGLEGLGKNYMFITTGIALAKRGYSILGHPHVRAYATQFLPAITQPFGHSFTSYDVWGGSGYDDVIGGYKFSAADMIGLKWIFPNDPKVDFVWRNYIEKSWNLSSEGYVYQQINLDDSYNNYLLPAAIFALDYDDSNTWTAQSASIVEEDYIDTDRGLAVMRSGADEDDLAVQFHCRQDMGGHTHGDKNDITLSALGRIWLRKSYSGSQFQPTWFHSTILIDDIGMGVGDPDGDKCRQPGKLLEWTPNDTHTKVAGDATYAYTWEWHWSPQAAGNNHPWLGWNGWEKVTETWNDFQFISKTEAHYNIPFYDMPHWHQPFRFERMVKRPFNPMEKVFRTVGVFKGDHPFVLVVDDVKKDANVHNYKWLGQIARDLTIESTTVNLSDDNYQADIILMEPASEGNRRLLVRVLNNENYDGTNPPGYTDILTYTDYFSGNPYTSNPNLVRPRLIVESNSISPDFKVMLYPHYSGDPLPETDWNAAHDTLTITCGTDDMRIAFETNATGRTEFTLIDNILPVELLNFNGFNTGKGNQLKWTTVSEINNDFFKIMHSRNGNDFKEIGRVEGAHNSTEILDYDFLHETNATGLHYYHLTQVDEDGTESNSKIITIEIKRVTPIAYPNPAKDNLFIDIDGNSEASRILLFIYDTKGALIQQFELDKGKNKLNVSHLNQGAYFYEIMEDNVKISSGNWVKE